MVNESLNKDFKRCIEDDGFHDMVATCAYYKAEKRGFAPGLELHDWLEAEQEMWKRCFYWFQDV